MIIRFLQDKPYHEFTCINICVCACMCNSSCCASISREHTQIITIFIYVGHDWNRIKQELLPSKDEQLLQFRFRQLTASDVPDNRFRRYLQLEKEKKTRDSKWTHSEDLNLLRGIHSIVFYDCVHFWRDTYEHTYL